MASCCSNNLAAQSLSVSNGSVLDVPDFLVPEPHTHKQVTRNGRGEGAAFGMTTTAEVFPTFGACLDQDQKQ